MESPVPQNFFSLKNQLFSSNVAQSIELQTESRIEIISNTNRNNKYMSKYLIKHTTRNLLIFELI